MVLKGFRYLFTGLRWVAAVLFFAATVLTSTNAILRYVFNYTIFGSEELSSYIVLVMSFLMFPIMEAENKHLTIDMFVNSRANQKFKDVVFVLRGLVTMGLIGIVTYYGWRVTSTAIMYHSASPALHIPKSLLFGVTTVSFAFVIVAWIAIIVFNKRRPL